MAPEDGSTARSISVERVIAAPPQQIFDVLADPSRHAEFDGSDTVKKTRNAPARLAEGSTFGMSMRMGVPYRVTNTVVEFEEGRRIGWWHAGHNLWRYELEPVADGTLVRETFDWSKSRAPWFVESTGFPARNRKGMEATLERLAYLVEQGTPYTRWSSPEG
jgi:uncharacterized protein YndB with AHSA1/START domain